MNLCFRLTTAAFLLTVSIYCNSLPHTPSGKFSTVVAACQPCTHGTEKTLHSASTAGHYCVHNMGKSLFWLQAILLPHRRLQTVHQRHTADPLSQPTGKRTLMSPHFLVAAAPTGVTDTHTTVSPIQVQLAPVSNQSTDASAAIIASISLHGQGLVPFGQKQRQVLMSALSATVTASTRMALTSMQVLSISEFVPNNTPSSPAPSRRLLVKRPHAGKQKTCTRP